MLTARCSGKMNSAGGMTAVAAILRAMDLEVKVSATKEKGLVKVSSLHHQGFRLHRQMMGRRRRSGIEVGKVAEKFHEENFRVQSEMRF